MNSIRAALRELGRFLQERQHWVLLGLLIVLHLALLAGNTTIGLMLWFVDVGFFILWQPFFQTERKLDYSNLLVIALVLGLGAWLFNWWLLIIWVVILASLLGGRVLQVTRRSWRIPYLMAFAYLVGAVLIWLVPKVVPDFALMGLSLERVFAWGAPLLFLGMIFMPRPQQDEWHLHQSGIVDFFYSLSIALLISVLVLGSLAFMMLQQTLYFEALSRTVLSMAVLLFLIAWLWNPRPGFSGLGIFFSQYMMSISLPFEVWLRLLMDCSEKEDDPDRFMQLVCDRLLSFDSTWIVGGEWMPAPGAEAGNGNFGKASSHKLDFSHYPLLMTIYTRYPLSPVQIMHFQVLAQLTNESYLAKWRARQLQHMSYLRAIHETGARLTHDVKNLLQSLDGLCYMVQTSEEQNAGALRQLLRRQLPQIGLRLHQTLLRLQAPSERQQDEQNTKMAAKSWWTALQLRFPKSDIVFEPVEFEQGACLPVAVFDSVAENCLNNAMTKRQNENDVRIQISISPDASLLRICDSGSAISDEMLVNLFRAPVPSENGLGIGLYHAARQAESSGYSLQLAKNKAGLVCFELIKTASF